MTIQIGNLLISKLELNVHLGWTQDERVRTQTVFVDIEIRYADAPRACHTDKLEDTLCYDQLIRVIREKLSKQHFQLIEHLANTIYHCIQSLLPDNTRANVRVHKYPNIDGLTDGVYFSFGDFVPSW